MEQRAFAEDERAVLRPIDLGAREIRGQEIGRELQAMKVTFDAVTQNFDRARLGETGRAFDEQMAVGEQRHEHSIQQPFLADDEAFQMRLELPELFL